MGKFSVEFEVANRVDIVEWQRGVRPKDKVRRLTIRGVVDSGATKLVLPGRVAKQLGLPVLETTNVRYANNRTATRQIVADAQVLLLEREGIYTAIVEPHRKSALIGAIVLEDLDLLVDCTNQRLVPRDERFKIAEIE